VNLTSLTAKQRAIWRAMADHRMVVCDGSVRSGKSIGADIAWLDFTRNGPRGNLLMAGRTRSTLERNIIDPLVEMLGSKRCRYVQGSSKLYIGGRQIYVVGANDERAQEKIRGVTLVGAYVDEASTLPESFWKMLLSRLSVEGARLIATTNPDGPMHWLKRGFLDRAQELDLARFQFRLSDNPHLPAAYVEAIMREYVGLWRRRFIDGEWVAAEGAIYDTLEAGEDGRHLCSSLPELYALTLAIDYGTSNPFSALLLGIGQEKDGPERLYVAREWRWDSSARRRQLTDPEYSERLTKWLEGGCDGFSDGVVYLEGLVIDPSASSMRLQLQRDGYGWAKKADNAVLDGIRDVASLIGADRLRIHESCTEVRRELSGYVWDAKAQARGEDAPTKSDDHGPDALRYGVRHLRRHWRGWLITPQSEKEAA